MNEMLALAVADILPARAVVIKCAGLPAAPEARHAALVDRALELLAATVAPAAIVQEVSVAEFRAIHAGEGRNEPDTPLMQIYPRATRLALFVATIGEPISRRIGELFAARDFALAAILDAAASEAADRAAEAVELQWAGRASGPAGTARTPDAGAPHGDWAARSSRYSPGYCGWHLSGQRALFAVLHPERIGVGLRESCLMEPLKSVSGVIVVGPPEIHVSTDDYPFCSQCRAHGCRERLRGF